MPVIAVDLALMRDVLLPGLTLTPGRAVMARVVSAQAGRGTLAIAGYLLDAELPAHVRAGQDLRLEVRDVDAHRVLLGISERPGEGDSAGQTTPDTAQAPPPAPAVPLPGGGRVRVADEDPGGGHRQRAGGDAHALSLRYDAPALGPVDLRVTLDPASLQVTVALAPGGGLARARDAADELRAALAAAVGRPVTVTVTGRHEPLDVYA